MQTLTIPVLPADFSLPSIEAISADAQSEAAPTPEGLAINQQSWDWLNTIHAELAGLLNVRHNQETILEGV